MRLYADHGPRRARQVTGDLLTALWLGVAGVTAGSVGVALSRLGDRTTTLATDGHRSARQLGTSADSVAGIPLAGSSLATPLRTIQGSVQSLSDGLDGEAATLHRAALFYGITVTLLAVAVPLLAWALTRGRWIRRASAVGGVLGEDDLEVLATAAAAGAGVRALRRLPPGTVLAWRAGDPQARRLMASAGLRKIGLRPRD